MSGAKGSVLERMAYTAVDLRRQVATDPTGNAFKSQMLDRLDAEFQAQPAEVLDILTRRARLDDADSQAIVAYLATLLC